jgi:hypothetical protein
MDIMLSSSLLYRSYGYSGLANLHVELHDVRGANIYRVTTGGMDMASDDLYAVLPDYGWDLQFTTAELNDKQAFIERIAELLETFHWDLGDVGITIHNAKVEVASGFDFSAYGLEDSPVEKSNPES